MKIRNKLIFITLLSFFFFNILDGCSLKRGYQALKIYNYFKAKKIFEHGVKRKTPGAHFGLAKIYFRSDNPFHDYDSAYVNILRSEKKFDGLNARQKERVKPYGIDSSSINRLFKKICQSAFIAATDSNTIPVLNHYIHFYAHSFFVQKAINERNSLAFQEAMKINNSDAYKKFLDTYPKALEHEFAKKMYDSTLFEEHTHSKTIKAYKNFARNFPNSPYLSRAYNQIYLLSTKNKTLKSYLDFIRQNGENPNVNEAWKNVLALSATDFTAKELDDFLKKYPDYPQKETLKQLSVLNRFHYFQIKSDGKWGFTDDEGVIRIVPEYDWEGNFYNGIAIVQKDSEYLLINKIGKEIKLPKYDDVNHFVHGYAVVSKNNKYGLINRFGGIVIPLKYDYLSPPQDNLCLAERDNKYGYLSANGNVSIPFNFNLAGDFNSGFAYVEKDSLYGIIDSLGKYTVQPKFEWISPIESKTFKAKSNHRFGLLSTNGDTLVPFAYNYIGNFSDSAILAIDSSNYLYYNHQGDTILMPKLPPTPGMYDWANFKDGFARFSKSGKFGLLGKDGKTAIKTYYDEISYFDSSIAIAQKGDLFFLFNLKSHQKKELAETTSSLTEVGKLLIQGVKSGKHYLLNRKGKVLVDFGNAYVATIEANNKYLLVSDSSKQLWGIYEAAKRQFLLKPEFEKIEYLKDDVFRLTKNKQKMLYNADLKRIIWKQGDED